MREKVLSYTGSLLGGMIHNINTPLMWIMGRSQLIEARNECLEQLKDLPDEEIIQIKDKNIKDIASIAEGADKIDSILKAVGYKVQMANEGQTAVELREYLSMETNFLMADMRFKHETQFELYLENSSSCYVKVDYNALSWSVIGIINTIIGATERGRNLKITLDNGIIRFLCPQMEFSPKIDQEIEQACSALKEHANVEINGSNGCEIAIVLKGA